ncbi:hypothetical protein FE391_32815 [Nonomuraea sp. KC401]|uniref:hypothetical protein n=1 Tax=unclassified Nonomuraea TaxID=2593643 RepID=UPI0010FD19EF|nr:MULTISPECIES: hypothetical protein [unclassified Nonomuraea]NBE98459.1 hypothetical protein [Nonomuraea sp. K271]TLF60960.1 hypothetical protein FE391_32815 [Nonomuraea sp. KC401]
MRGRLPAALVFLLSWFLPAVAHAQPVQPVVTVKAATVAAGQQPTARQHPLQPTALRMWAGAHVFTGGGGTALPASEPLDFRHAWAVVVTRPAAEATAQRKPAATPARAPPSTGC